MSEAERGVVRHELTIPAPEAPIAGTLVLPAGAGARAVVLFAPGRSGGASPRDARIAAALHEAGFATLHTDLLTPEELRTDERTGHLRFDIDLLASRMLAATRVLCAARETAGLPIGYVGAGTGAAAAIQATVLDRSAYAVVSRSGRPDLALQCLPKVRVPTLLIVGGDDVPLVPLNQQAFDTLACEKKLVVLQGVGHQFEEPGAIDSAARLATEWLQDRLPGRG